MGIVVLRSTTPCVAVNSRSNSTLLTVISMVPAATAASTGITYVPRYCYLRCYFYYYLITNKKPKNPAEKEGAGEKWKTGTTRLLSPGSRHTLDVRNRSRTLRRRQCNLAILPISALPCTTSTSHSQPP